MFVTAGLGFYKHKVNIFFIPKIGRYNHLNKRKYEKKIQYTYLNRFTFLKNVYSIYIEFEYKQIFLIILFEYFTSLLMFNIRQLNVSWFQSRNVSHVFWFSIAYLIKKNRTTCKKRIFNTEKSVSFKNTPRF